MKITDEMVEAALLAFHGTRKFTTNRPSMRAALTAALSAGGAGAVKRMSMALERERSAVAEALTHIKRAIAGRGHLRFPGRGSYAWDDERYQLEFGHALDEIEAALEPLRRIARDWTDCPTDPAEIQAARASPTPIQAVDWEKAVEGYVLVPKEPTEAMRSAGFQAATFGGNIYTREGNDNIVVETAITRDVYRAMLAASTAPEEDR